MRKRRGELTRWEVETLSAAAQKHILAETVWKEAKTVGVYIPVRRETGTHQLAENAWDEGKDVLVPCTPPSLDGVMYFLPCLKGQPLMVNRYGIPEPAPETRPAPSDSNWIPEVIIVPGVAFDRKGRRIGSGGGYYDRLFAKPSFKDAVRIGIGYSFQVVSRDLPMDKWDAPLHALATEDGILWF